MRTAHTLTVRASVLLFVAVATACSLLLAALGWQQGRSSEVLADRLLVQVQLARAAGTADMMHDALRATTLAARLAGPAAADADKQGVRAELAEFTKTFGEAIGTIEKLATAEIAAALADVKPTVERYGITAGALVNAALTDPAQAAPLVAGFDRDFEALEDRLEKLSALIEADAEATVQRRDTLYRDARLALGALLLATVAVLLGLGLPFARRLIRRLGAEPARLREFAQSIADGELDTRFDRSQLHDGSVAEAMLKMRDQLRSTVRTIRDGAREVSDSSVQIAAGNQDLAQRTEQQAAQLQQAASSMEQMTGSVQQSADHAQTARQLAAGAAQVAADGGAAMQRMVQTMGAIQSSSQRIAEIVALIDSIAFQTNILALNAAVEAARAGEQGRGFAVVAAEVRSLAQRSAGAAREIKALIDASVADVDAGHHQAQAAGRTIEDVVAQVQRVNHFIAEISAAAGEQTQGIRQVNDSVARLDQGTQHNAALVEQSAAAAQALQQQAKRLAATVSAFRLAEG